MSKTITKQSARILRLYGLFSNQGIMPIGGLGWLEMPISFQDAMNYLTSVQADRERKMAAEAEAKAKSGNKNWH